MTHVLLLGAALLAIPLTAVAQEGEGPSPSAIVGERQSRMGGGGGDLAGLKKAADAGEDLHSLAPRAQRLVQWAETLPTMFPDGSNVSPTDAREAVWSDRAGFHAKAGEFAAAARTLAAAVEAGDREAFATSWAATRATCAGCHDLYKN